VGQGGLIKQLAGKIVQRALETEMDLHLGYEKHPAGDYSGDSRKTRRHWCFLLSLLSFC
jgi:transposase-like protein